MPLLCGRLRGMAAVGLKTLAVHYGLHGAMFAMTP